MMQRIVPALFIITILAGGVNAQTKPLQTSATDVSQAFKPLFEMYCITCHNQTWKSGGLAVDSLNTGNVGENMAVWEKMLQRLRARRDPPIGMARPDEALYETAISIADRALDRAHPTDRTVKIGRAHV